MKRLLVGLFLVMALQAQYAAALPLVDIDVSAGLSRPSPSGNITYGGGSGDLKNTLNLGTGSDTIIRLDLSHEIPFIPNIYIHHLPVKVEGESDLASDFRFGGTNFLAGTKVSSVINLAQDDIGLYYHIPMLRSLTMDILDLKVGLNARLFGFTASVSNATTKEEKSFSSPIPMLYVGADIKPVELISVVGELKALSIGGNSITEFSGELRIKPIHFLYIGLGYASESLSVDSNNIKASVTFSEPYAVIGAEF